MSNSTRNTTDLSAKDAIAEIEAITDRATLIEFVPESETRTTVIAAYNKKLNEFSTRNSQSLDINDYLLTIDDQPDEGADVRVRPEPARPVTYGQGAPLPGPKLQNVQFVWGAALEVDASCSNGIGDPEAGLVHPNTIAQSPGLFMLEAKYQEYQSTIENNEE